MKPDLQNKWMEAELGTFEETQPAAAPKPRPSKSSGTLGSAWDLFYLLLRIGVSLFFAYNGAQKLFGIFSGEPGQHDNSILAMGAMEFLGGVILALGVYTRPVALFMFVAMAWVYYKHCPMGSYWPIPTGGGLPLFFGAFFLILLAFGPGNISIDKMQHRK